MTYTILQAELAQGPCPACGQPITYDYAIDATELQTITLEASKTVVDIASRQDRRRGPHPPRLHPQRHLRIPFVKSHQMPNRPLESP